MVEFSHRTREKDIAGLDGRRFKCVIIGGGIVGAGLANLLSHNGIETLLVDKGDFASGTSSGSSKLIHGGIRYLAQGHLKLTRDLLRERNYLMENTDIVKRLDFDILVDEYSWSPSYIRLGLFLYSILGGEAKIPRMVRNSGKYAGGVKGYFPYFDGMTDDSMLVMSNVVSAHNRGATCLNYLEAKKIRDSGDGSVKIGLEDRVGKNRPEVSADIVINCGGPWVNRILGLYREGEEIPMKLSKGVHLIIDRGKLPAERAVTFRSHIDRRQMFVIPREHVCIIGTTESLVNSPDSFSISDDDEDYIVKSVARLYPGLSRDDVIGRYCGIRPLVGKGSNPDRISRDFLLFEHGNMISVAGVKLTDFRQSSRKIARKISSVTGWKIRRDNLPVIDYHRGASADRFIEMVENECVIFPSDATRRRDGSEIYNPGNLSAVRDRVVDAMRKSGMEVPDELA